MPGETYVQYILNELNSVSVRGRDDMAHMLSAIRMLERLKKDILEHKNAPEEEDV